MSEPKEKKTGPGPDRKPAGQSGEKKSPQKPEERKPEKASGKAPEKATGKAPERKPGRPAPRRSTGGPKPPAKPEPPLTTRQKVLRGLYMALTVVSAIIVLGYIGFHLFSAPPDVTTPGPEGVETVPRPQFTTAVDDEGNVIEVEIPGLPADRKKEFYTFLMVGQSQDTGGKLSDTMMLAAYDVPNQTLSVMSLPRDTWVRYNGRTMLINAVYNAAGGYNDDEKGIAGLKTAVKDLTGIYPDFHVIIQWEALGELVDAIGGVYYDVPFDMYYNDLSQHFKIDLKKGYQLLDGEGAMGLVRWRKNSDDYGHEIKGYGYAEGDIGRIKTQQAFLKEVIKKCLQTDVLLGNLTEYIRIFQENVVTNLSASNMAYFGKSAIGGLDMDNVTFTTLPNRSAGDGAHLLPIGSQIVSAVNDGFNPYEEPIRVSELRLADASPLVTSTPDPEETVDPEETGGPNETDDPDSTASPRPSGGDNDIVLPPGSITRPPASPDPTGSAAPSGSESPRPSGSAAPAGSESPRPSGSANPGGVTLPSGNPVESEAPSPTPAETPAPTPGAEPTPAPPAPTPPGEDDEPVLPPM